jgi:hypothetical protein
MADVVETMAGVVPIAIGGGLAMTMTQAAFGECATPGRRIRSKGRGRGLARGRGRGPIGVPVGAKGGVFGRGIGMGMGRGRRIRGLGDFSNVLP